MLRAITLVFFLLSSSVIYASGYIVRSDENTLKLANVLALATINDVKVSSEKCARTEDYELQITKTLAGNLQTKPVKFQHFIFIFSDKDCPNVHYIADPLASNRLKGNQIVVALQLSSDGKNYDVVGSWDISEQDRLIKLMKTYQ